MGGLNIRIWDWGSRNMSYIKMDGYRIVEGEPKGCWLAFEFTKPVSPGLRQIMSGTGIGDKNRIPIYQADVLMLADRELGDDFFLVVWNPERGGYSLQQYSNKEEVSMLDLTAKEATKYKVVGNTCEDKHLASQVNVE
jgi:hypothetical protein